METLSTDCSKVSEENQIELLEDFFFGIEFQELCGQLAGKWGQV